MRSPIRHASYPYVLDKLPRGTFVNMAVSTRRLTSKYAGPCMLVREGAGSATLDIPFCGRSICRSTLSKFCAGTTGYVRTWYDQGGNGCHCDQSVAGSQPSVFASGDIIKDGYGIPRVFFNGGGIMLTFDATKMPNGSNPSTTFIMYNSASPSAVRGRFTWGTNSAGQYRELQQTSANQPRVTNGTTTANTSTADTNLGAIVAFRMARSVNPSETIRVRLDNASNTLQTATAHPATWATGTTAGKLWGRISDAINHVGYVSETFTVAAELSDTDMDVICRDMEEYYGFNR